MLLYHTHWSSSLVIFVIAIALGTFADEEQATLEVDALVNDDENEPTRALGTPLTGQVFEQPRRSTPSVPPGFTAPAIPRGLAGEGSSLPGSRPGSRPMSRTTSSTIVPAVPVVPVTPAKPETPAKMKKGKQLVKAPEALDVAPVPSMVAIPATPTKSTTKGTGMKAQDITEPLSQSPADAATKKTESKEKKSTSETTAKTTAKGKAANKKVEKVEKAAEESSQKMSDSVTTAFATTAAKRQHPGKLDITAAKAVDKEPAPAATSGKTDTSTKNARTVPPTTTPSVPASPAVAAAPSPVKHTVAPRTLRLVSTPKVETPPAVAAPPPPPLPQIPTVDKLRSRQASIASLNQPGTPVSELVSDTASMTSGMISRAGSPPPANTIVGSAPVRKITKAQAKKNRQERKRQEEEKEKAEAGSDIEVVQAPIIGRKKKAKKPNTTPKPVAAMASAMKEAAAKSLPASPKSATVEDELLETPTVASVKAHSARNSAAATPEPEAQPEDVKERREPSAQSVLNDLQKTGDLLVSALEFFKPLSSSLSHTSRIASSGHATMPPDLKIHFSEADLDAIAKKMPVHINGQDGKPDSRTLITPNGTFLWGLTAELEERALYLEAEIEKLAGYLRFHPTTRASPNHNAPYSSADVLPALATAIREAAVPKKLPNSPTNNLKFDSQTYSQQLPPVHPSEFSNAHALVPTQQQTPADAGAYLNQFVLPATDNPPPNHPRPEMAAVGGTPGSGTTHISIQPGPGRQAEGFEKAARAVVEGGAVGSTEIDGLASMTGDKSGGVWVRGLEGLIGAGLGMNNARDRAEIRKVLEGLDQAGYALPSSSPLDSHAGVDSAGGRHVDRRCVLGLEEAEAAMALARREQEVLERKLGALVKRNRKLATGNAR
ncbi:general negative regulator of transcription subunit 4 [Stagonosporopsis vannaccii]|nr:general negative regulator of transcription subunit 4 [Stagonosporopsis vannaccii]